MAAATVPSPSASSGTEQLCSLKPRLKRAVRQNPQRGQSTRAAAWMSCDRYDPNAYTRAQQACQAAYFIKFLRDGPGSQNHTHIFTQNGAVRIPEPKIIAIAVIHLLAYVLQNKGEQEDLTQALSIRDYLDRKDTEPSGTQNRFAPPFAKALATKLLRPHYAKNQALYSKTLSELLQGLTPEQSNALQALRFSFPDLLTSDGGRNIIPRGWRGIGRGGDATVSTPYPSLPQSQPNPWSLYVLRAAWLRNLPRFLEEKLNVPPSEEPEASIRATHAIAQILPEVHACQCQEESKGTGTPLESKRGSIAPFKTITTNPYRSSAQTHMVIVQPTPRKTTNLFRAISKTVQTQQRNYNYQMWLNQLLGISKEISRQHQHSIPHADLKPSNILLDKGNQFQIIDPGLYESRGNIPKASEKYSPPHEQVIGTPPYRAHEWNIRTAQKSNVPSSAIGVTDMEGMLSGDVFSFGCICFFIFCRSHPQWIRSPPATESQHSTSSQRYDEGTKILIRQLMWLGPPGATLTLTPTAWNRGKIPRTVQVPQLSSEDPSATAPSSHFAAYLANLAATKHPDNPQAAAFARFIATCAAFDPAKRPTAQEASALLGSICAMPTFPTTPTT